MAEAGRENPARGLQARCLRGDRRGHRRGAGDGVAAVLRPEPLHSRDQRGGFQGAERGSRPRRCTGAPSSRPIRRRRRSSRWSPWPRSTMARSRRTPRSTARPPSPSATHASTTGRKTPGGRHQCETRARPLVQHLVLSGRHRGRAVGVPRPVPALGFGERSGLPLIGETPGLVPNDEWMLKHEKRRILDGDTANHVDRPGQPAGIAAAGGPGDGGHRQWRQRCPSSISSARCRTPADGWSRHPSRSAGTGSASIRRRWRSSAKAWATWSTAVAAPGRSAALSYTKLCGKTGTAQWGPHVEKPAARVVRRIPARGQSALLVRRALRRPPGRKGFRRAHGRTDGQKVFRGHQGRHQGHHCAAAEGAGRHRRIGRRGGSGGGNRPRGWGAGQ